jgi:tRNA A37 threonylcarbamoyladenosine biosynthesis protein TsaE
MIEWPEKAAQVLPQPDIHVTLSMLNLDQNTQGRKIQFAAGSPLGKECLKTY